MIAYTEKIRKIAQGVLQQCRVEMVIGFRAGSIPMMNEPCFIRKPEDARHLVWDGNCGINLANYLIDRKEKKIGIVAKGCDSRNIVTHILENKIRRDQLVVIGVPCTGMIDKHRIIAQADGAVRSVIESDDRVVVKTSNGETAYDRVEVLQSNCRICRHPNPVIDDEMVAGPVPIPDDTDGYVDVKAVAAMPADQRWQYFEDLFSSCIRCYACRNACPLCYCPTCFVDESNPQWVGKSQDPMDIRTFHYLRAYHCAGRCTDCGACERACPVGIKMRILTQKLNKDCLELYGWEAGLSLESRPALEVYNPNDPETFIQ